MNKETKNEKYTEVWGDTVVLKELLYSCVIGVFLTMGMFFLGQKIFHSFENIENILESAGITLEEEIEALSKLDSETIKELEDLELYALLALIPEDSKNYKKEYKEKAKGGV